MRITKAVLFDLDGVLIDSKEAWFHLVNATARRFAKPAIEQQLFNASWGQGIEADLESFFVGCTQPEIENFYEQHLLDFRTSIWVDPEAQPTLRALHSAGVKVALVTNTPTDLATRLCAWAELLNFLDVVIGADPSRPPKPAPDGIVLACQEIGVGISESLFIGDSRYDEQAALNAHCKFLGFRMQTRDSISQLSEILERIDAT